MSKPESVGYVFLSQNFLTYLKRLIALEPRRCSKRRHKDSGQGPFVAMVAREVPALSTWGLNTASGLHRLHTRAPHHGAQGNPVEGHLLFNVDPSH